MKKHLHFILAGLCGGLAGYFSVSAANLIHAQELTILARFIPLGFYLSGYIAASVITIIMMSNQWDRDNG